MIDEGGVYLGVMQGRLSPPVDGRLQAFPQDHWREEFRQAAAGGLSLIEWIFEGRNWEHNPLLIDPSEIRKLSHLHNVGVETLCADYFMDYPLIRVGNQDRADRTKVFERLAAQASAAGVRVIGMPFVDNAAIVTRDDMDQAVRSLTNLMPCVEQHGLLMALETSLAPAPFLELLEKLHHPCVRVNYDIGNSASLGYDPREEMQSYGRWVATVHIKDRLLGGGTVPLGTGAADFDVVFSELARCGFHGPLLFQAARGTVGVEPSTLEGYRRFVFPYLERHFEVKTWNSNSKTNGY